VAITTSYNEFYIVAADNSNDQGLLSKIEKLRLKYEKH